MIRLMNVATIQAMAFDSVAAPLPYHAMRLRWCGQALRALVKRWGVYFAVAAVAFGAGTSGASGMVLAAASGLVLPLFIASAHGAWLLPAVLLQALAGAALVWGLRSLLWPVSWADAERALPLTPAQTLLSDAAVVLLAMLPLWLLYGLGAATVLGNHPPWLQATRWLGVAALLLACAGGVAVGVALLQRLRQPVLGQLASTGSGQPAASARPFALPRSTHWLRALIGLALWRGPARRTAWACAVGTALLALPGAALLLLGAGAGWCLAGFAALAMAVVARVNKLSRLEFDPLFADCAHLPLAAAPLRQSRVALCLWPLVPGLTVLCMALRWSEVRPAVLAAYALACVASCAIEVWAASVDASAKSSRWLLCLALCVALATEVMR